MVSILRTRIITGVIGIAITTGIIQIGGPLFMIMALLLGLLTWNEFVNAFAHRDTKLPRLMGFISISLIILSANFTVFPLLPFFVATMLILFTMIFQNRQYTIAQTGIALAGIIYIGLPFYHLVALRMLSDPFYILFNSILGQFTLGTSLVWLMFIGTWASDSFAYFVGCSLGKHRLCPDISPKKSIEGFIGGIIGAIILCNIVGYYFAFSYLFCTVAGALIAIIGTLGDLVESSIKRYAGIKDSGTLIPGHGGVWDRFDSLLFTAPLVYYLALVFLMY